MPQLPSGLNQSAACHMMSLGQSQKWTDWAWAWTWDGAWTWNCAWTLACGQDEPEPKVVPDLEFKLRFRLKIRLEIWSNFNLEDTKGKVWLGTTAALPPRCGPYAKHFEVKAVVVVVMVVADLPFPLLCLMAAWLSFYFAGLIVCSPAAIPML